MGRQRARPGFTLIELLVVIAIIAVLISILMPAASRARASSKGVVCLSRLRNLGQGLLLYSNNNHDALPPARLPKLDDDRWRSRILGGIKYRPTFLAMMGNEVGLKPFEDPRPSANEVDRFGQPGDRQNYSNEQYVCPETPEWVDERNGSYGYNYQFLGNARLLKENLLTSYKNWPVTVSSVKAAAECVAVGDSMGTAATFASRDRAPYEDNAFGDGRSARHKNAYGNEGFNLDPPRVDPEHGEMAGLDDSPPLRTAVHPRHVGRGNVLWLDGHASPESLTELGYRVSTDGSITSDGDNRYFSANNRDSAWQMPGSGSRAGR